MSQQSISSSNFQQFIPKTPPLKPKRKKLLLVLIIAFGTVVFSLFFLSKGHLVVRELYRQWREAKEGQKAFQQFEQALDEYYQAFKNDTYGGKTPQETLNLFIDALEKGDLDLAAKYFAMDNNLSREKWENALKETAKAGKLSSVIEILKQMKPSPIEPAITTTYEFVIIGKESELVDFSVEMELNEYSGVWKIRSM